MVLALRFFRHFFFVSRVKRHDISWEDKVKQEVLRGVSVEIILKSFATFNIWWRNQNGGTTEMGK